MMAGPVRIDRPAMKIQLDAAIHLLHEAPSATLATWSTQVEGYPYATPVPLVCDERHLPLLFVSALAEHTRNLLADGRASLAVVEGDGRAVQSAARLTLLGEFERCAAEAALVARYLRYLPDAAAYLELDFMFFRLVPRRLRFIAGIGRMGWLEAADLAAAPTLAPTEEAALLAGAALASPAGARLLGIDPLGIDYEVDGVRHRQRFAAPAGDAGELRWRLTELLATLR